MYKERWYGSVKMVRLLNVILIWGLHLWMGEEHVLQGVQREG